MPPKMQTFDTGATRSNDEEKNDYEGFLSPRVIEAYGDYMHHHRKQADGVLRDSDNWQKGMPLPKYMKSLWRHFLHLWKLHRGLVVKDEDDGHLVTKQEALCAILFNVMGYLHVSLGMPVEQPETRGLPVPPMTFFPAIQQPSVHIGGPNFWTGRDTGDEGQLASPGKLLSWSDKRDKV